jgi:hypothetical protein
MRQRYLSTLITGHCPQAAWAIAVNLPYGQAWPRRRGLVLAWRSRCTMPSSTRMYRSASNRHCRCQKQKAGPARAATSLSPPKIDRRSGSMSRCRPARHHHRRSCRRSARQCLFLLSAGFCTRRNNCRFEACVTPSVVWISGRCSSIYRLLDGLSARGF